MMAIRNKILSMLLVTSFLMIGGLSMATRSFADAFIPYSVIGTNEYNLPVGFDKPINLLASYNVWSNITDYHGEDGENYDALLSVNKFVRLFTIDGLENWGFLWEGVVGFGGLGFENGASLSGLIDPQTGMVAWTKPIPSWTLCFEYWLHLPWGSNELSDGSVNHTLTMMNNHQLFDGKFVIDWDFGYKMRGDGRKLGTKYEYGNSLFTNWVFTYKHNPWVNPNIHFDWESGGSGKNKSADTDLASYDRMQLGIGNSMKITDRLLFDIWYSYGIDGRNIARTNNVYTRFVWSF
ncbi:MAG: transporter [Syntrophotalea acetylenica]|nr:transporter [Syntrophotalea acetylenica]